MSRAIASPNGRQVVYWILGCFCLFLFYFLRWGCERKGGGTAPESCAEHPSVRTGGGGRPSSGCERHLPAARRKPRPPPTAPPAARNGLGWERRGVCGILTFCSSALQSSLDPMGQPRCYGEGEEGEKFGMVVKRGHIQDKAMQPLS